MVPNDIIVISYPKKNYFGKPKKQVSEEYNKMAIKDFDGFVSFAEEYKQFQETPDLEQIAGKKNGHNLNLTLFADQPVTRIGGLRSEFTSSSYLFNPDFGDGLFLPDLEAVELKHTFEHRCYEGAKELTKFYILRGWTSRIFEGKIIERQTIIPPSSRGIENIEIIPLDTLRGIAKDLGYEGQKFYFDN